MNYRDKIRADKNLFVLLYAKAQEEKEMNGKTHLYHDLDSKASLVRERIEINIQAFKSTNGKPLDDP